MSPYQFIQPCYVVHTVSPYISFCTFDGNTGKQTTASFCFFAHHHGSTAQKSELFAQKLLSPHLRLCAHLSAYNDQAAKGDQGYRTKVISFCFKKKYETRKATDYQQTPDKGTPVHKIINSNSFKSSISYDCANKFVWLLTVWGLSVYFEKW